MEWLLKTARVYNSHQAQYWKNKCIAPARLLLFRRDYDQSVEDQSFTYHQTFRCVYVLFSISEFGFILPPSWFSKCWNPPATAGYQHRRTENVFSGCWSINQKYFEKQGSAPLSCTLIAAVMPANALLCVLRSGSSGHIRGYSAPKKCISSWPAWGTVWNVALETQISPSPPSLSPSLSDESIFDSLKQKMKRWN